ncbi:hypothetical protein L1049_000184 [Liquidambar formosana]|uniref:Uncharacterized protein n=1 Tax=Liquidambar formosana TaxID=63359 RepID=A0AAP0NBW5_LIQFO
MEQNAGWWYCGCVRSPSSTGQSGFNGKKRVRIIVSSVLLAGMLLLGLGLTVYVWKKKKLSRLYYGKKKQILERGHTNWPHRFILLSPKPKRRIFEKSLRCTTVGRKNHEGINGSLVTSNATDTITMSQSVRDDDKTIDSAGGNFELGFFSSFVSGIKCETIVMVSNATDTITMFPKLVLVLSKARL